MEPATGRRTNATKGRFRNSELPIGQRQPKTGLTPRQREIYEFIFDSTMRLGYQPSIREICQKFGIASLNGCVCHFKALAKRGYILPTAGGYRALEFIKKPDGMPFKGFQPIP